MGGYVGILFPPAQGVTLFTDGQHVPSIYLAAKPGVSEKTLTARVAAVLPADLKAETGDQVRQGQPLLEIEAEERPDVPKLGEESKFQRFAQKINA